MVAAFRKKRIIYLITFNTMTLNCFRAKNTYVVTTKKLILMFLHPNLDSLDNL